ncbi:hypothetical protein CF120_07895 [Aeromonas allosaccharophila]|nr:hypothetical protein CT153_03285 [Aeromonas veronii]TNI91714.1 hypothetical protein CF120_07895 [Aeromonas allosaccharophila]
MIARMASRKTTQRTAPRALGGEPSIGANIRASMNGVSAIRSAAEQAVAHDKGASVAGPFHCG